MSNITCPSCQRTFGSEDPFLDQINFECGAASYEKPEFEKFGYRFFFRGYLPEQASLRMMGFCLAWPTSRDSLEPAKKYFVSITQGGRAFRYQPGESFPIPATVELLDAHILRTNPRSFVEAKNKAMQNLLELVEKETQVKT